MRETITGITIPVIHSYVEPDMFRSGRLISHGFPFGKVHTFVREIRESSFFDKSRVGPY